jgi:hypothetical protein
MTEILVKSRIISSLAYDSDGRKLHIVFKNKQVRLFADVPPHVVRDMVSSQSPGQFYIEHIRKNFARIAA